MQTCFQIPNHPGISENDIANLSSLLETLYVPAK
jgi:hypothetical protein